MTGWEENKRLQRSQIAVIPFSRDDTARMSPLLEQKRHECITSLETKDGSISLRAFLEAHVLKLHCSSKKGHSLATFRHTDLKALLVTYSSNFTGKLWAERLAYEPKYLLTQE